MPFELGSEWDLSNIYSIYIADGRKKPEKMIRIR